MFSLQQLALHLGCSSGLSMLVFYLCRKGKVSLYLSTALEASSDLSFPFPPLVGRCCHFLFQAGIHPCNFRGSFIHTSLRLLAHGNVCSILALKKKNPHSPSVWPSEDNLHELVLSTMCSKDGTLIRFGFKCLYPMSHLVRSVYHF